MAKPKDIRRFLRFNLRSLMLLTLAVAAWLGYEVHQARTVQHQAEAIRALGGEVEFEASPWSLVRFIQPKTFGRRVVALEIRGDRVVDAFPALKAMPHLREVRVAYDGTCDVGPSWSALHSQFNSLRFVAVAMPVVDAYDIDCEEKERELRWSTSASKTRYERFARKLSESAKNRNPRDNDLPMSSLSPEQYHVLTLPNGSLAEVLVNTSSGFLKGWEVPIAVLLVGDHEVDSRVLQNGTISIRGAGGDVPAQLSVETQQKDQRRFATKQLAADPTCLELYAIEPTGFRKLLPEDRLKD